MRQIWRILCFFAGISLFFDVAVPVLSDSTLTPEIDWAATQKCGDPDCSAPIGEGRTLQRYFAKDPNLLSFGANKPVKIFSKDSNVWGVEIDGRRGFVNKMHIQETKVLNRNLKYTLKPLTENEQEIQERSNSTNESIPKSNNSAPSTQTDSSDVLLPGESVPPSLPVDQQPQKVVSVSTDTPSISQPIPPSFSSLPSDSPSIDTVENSKSVINPEIMSSMAVEHSVISHSHTDSLLGAHASHVSLSAEDMEYYRIQSTYVDSKGEYVLDGSVISTQLLSPSTLASSTSSFITLASAEETHVNNNPVTEQPSFEVFDGTTFYHNDFENAVINETPKSSQIGPDETKMDIKPTSTMINPTHEPMATFTDVESSQLGKETEKSVSSEEILENESTEPSKTDKSPKTSPPPLEEEANKGQPSQVTENANENFSPRPTSKLSDDKPSIQNSASPGEISKNHEAPGKPEKPDDVSKDATEEPEAEVTVENDETEHIELSTSSDDTPIGENEEEEEEEIEEESELSPEERKRRIQELQKEMHEKDKVREIKGSDENQKFHSQPEQEFKSFDEVPNYNKFSPDKNEQEPAPAPTPAPETIEASQEQDLPSFDQISGNEKRNEHENNEALENKDNTNTQHDSFQDVTTEQNTPKDFSNDRRNNDEEVKKGDENKIDIDSSETIQQAPGISSQNSVENVSDKPISPNSEKIINPETTNAQASHQGQQNLPSNLEVTENDHPDGTAESEPAKEADLETLIFQTEKMQPFVEEVINDKKSESHDAQDVKDMIDVQDVQDVQNVQDAQDVQDVQNVQDVQDVQNVQDVQDVQGLQDVQAVQDTSERAENENNQGLFASLSNSLFGNDDTESSKNNEPEEKLMETSESELNNINERNTDSYITDSQFSNSPDEKSTEEYINDGKTFDNSEIRFHMPENSDIKFGNPSAEEQGEYTTSSPINADSYLHHTQTGSLSFGDDGQETDPHQEIQGDQPVKEWNDELPPVNTPEEQPVEDQAAHIDATTQSVLDETVEHYVEASEDFLPHWFIHAPWTKVSPQIMFITLATGILLIICYTVYILTEQCSKESVMKEKLAVLEKELHQVRNESKIIKREADEVLKNSHAKTSYEGIPVLTDEANKETLEELEKLKEDHGKLANKMETEKLAWDEERRKLVSEVSELRSKLEQANQELAESESIVQECLEDKKRSKTQNSDELTRAIESLRNQLQAQQNAVGEYEAKIKKTKTQLREKVQELRNQRADTANAQLQLSKITKEHEELKLKLKSLEEKDQSHEEVQNNLENLKQKHLKAISELELRNSELEAKTTEVEVLTETVNQLKALSTSLKSKANKESSDGLQNEGDGWEFEDDDIEESSSDFSALEEVAQLKVDLRKAQEACEKLSDQLVKAETAKEEAEKSLFEQKEELEVARKAKELSITEKTELGKKLEVLTNFFNQREAELQKQLGMTANRLSDTSASSESAEKKIALLKEEVDSYKCQLQSMTLEMEDQERSFKSQIATLEKKQHESWVTVRQESRKLAEALSDSQTLRSRLTTVESKLVEKEFEISRLKEENESLMETVEKISRSSQVKTEPVFTNGNGSAASSTHNESLEPLPDLPPLPPLRAVPMGGPMSGQPPYMPGAGYMPPFLPPDVRPAPLGGRRSPPHGRGYSRSPSPPHSGDDYYRGSGARYHSHAMDGPEDLSRGGRGRYDSNRSYDRHSRDRSPDRYSSRSGRSDRSRYD